MSAFLYGIIVQWKLDLRNKGILLTYYMVPIVFFLFMSGIFTSVDPMAYKTLISSMTVFGVTMGSIIGSPTPLVEFFSSPIKKAYIVGKIPLWTIIVINFISRDRKSTRLNSSHANISYAVFCLKKKKTT